MKSVYYYLSVLIIFLSACHTNKSELETMFSEAERVYGNKSYIELEELLAEDFRKYV